MTGLKASPADGQETNAGDRPGHADHSIYFRETATATEGIGVTFHVRSATSDDAQTLGALRAELFSELGRLSASGHPAFERAAAQALADAIERADCFAWLAESAPGHPIGSVAMLVYPRLPSPDSPALQEGYLLNVYTAPDWRRRGVAAALVAAAIAGARDLGLGRIRLHATADGQRVYAAAGFTVRDDEMELRLFTEPREQTGRQPGHVGNQQH